MPFPLLAASLTLCLGIALPGAPAHAKPITLAAVKPCGKWLQERQPRNVRWGQTWLLGFLSGYALATEEDLLAGSDPDALFHWMDSYCTAHPQADIADGGQTLIAELEKKRAELP